MRSHFVFLQDPDQFNFAILHFFGRRIGGAWRACGLRIPNDKYGRVRPGPEADADRQQSERDQPAERYAGALVAAPTRASISVRSAPPRRWSVSFALRFFRTNR
jgi:hypothetical protein